MGSISYPKWRILSLFFRITMLYLWLSLLILLTFTVNKSVILTHLYKFIDVSFLLFYTLSGISEMLSFLHPSSSYMLKIHASLSVSHLSFLNMSLIRISYSSQSSAEEMKIYLKQGLRDFWPSLFWKGQSVPASSGKLWGRGWQQPRAGEGLPPETILRNWLSSFLDWPVWLMETLTFRVVVSRSLWLDCSSETLLREEGTEGGKEEDWSCFIRCQISSPMLSSRSSCSNPASHFFLVSFLFVFSSLLI